MKNTQEIHLTVKLKNDFFSLSGLSITIGFLGFLSSIVTMFINVNDQISIKWMVFTIMIAGIIVLIILKSLYDLSKRAKENSLPEYECPIKYIEENQIFIIQRNDHFTSNMILGCYIQKDEIESLAYLAVIEKIQEKNMHIKIRSNFTSSDKIPSSVEELKNITIRPYVTIDILNKIVILPPTPLIPNLVPIYTSGLL